MRNPFGGKTSNSGQAQDNRVVARKCRHATLTSGDTSAFGTPNVTTLPLVDGTVDYCLECLRRMAVACGWCGQAIFIGDPVTLYTSEDAAYTLPKGAVVYAQSPRQLVGCLSVNCAYTGGDRAGFWLPDDHGRGHVMRVESPLEKAMRTGGVVMVRDISDLDEALRDE